MDSRVSCRFVRRRCKHEELFLDSYLRTNRTNHTKIMRCFPHCCPTHRKRSYCGSPLFVQFEQALERHGRQFDGDELVVFGRFRPLSVAPLASGDRVSLATIESSLQRDDPSKGEWIEAELSHSNTNVHERVVSWVFEVNASGRWYYPWSGAATIALRATEHVFEVLVFRRCGAGDLQLLATATSSKFRLMSFRRAVTVANDAKPEAADTASDKGSPQHKTTSLSPPKAVAPTKKRTRDDEPLIKKEAKGRLSPKLSEIESHYRAPSPTQSTGSSTAHSTSPRTPTHGSLGSLVQWLDELPVSSAGSRRLCEWEQIVFAACTAHRAAARGEERPVRRELVSILSALQVSSTQPAAAAAPTLDVIDATMRTLLHLFLDVDCCESSSAVFKSPLDRVHFAAAHSAWASELEHRASRFADTRTKASWTNLLATAATLQHQKRVSAVEDAFAYRSFVAESRERLAQHELKQNERMRASQRRGLNGLSMAAIMDSKAAAFSGDSRVWVSRIEDVAIEMDVLSQNALTLLTILQFWRHLSCLRLEFVSASASHAPQLSVASAFNTSVIDACFTRLVLDGQYRWFNSLPSGDATTGKTLMGYVVGDYVGRATSAGTIHVSTFMWPTADSQALAHAWHWTIDAASLATGSMAISVIVESAYVQHRDPLRPFETMTIAEKLRSIGRWGHTCQAQLAYHAQ